MLFQNYVTYFLCRVAFISLMSRGRQSVYFAASDITRHLGLFFLLQQSLMQPSVRGSYNYRKVTYDVCLSICLCVFVSARLSVYLFISPQEIAYFQPGLHKLLIYAVWAYADIFMQDFFEPETRNVRNEPLASSQTLHKDRSNLLAFWIPNSTKESPSLEATIFHVV